MKNILSKLSFRFGLKHPMTYILPAVMGLLCVWCAYTATNDDVSSFIEPLCCLALLMLSALLSVIKIEPAENFIKKNPAVLLPLFSVGAFFQMELSIVNPFNRMSPIGYIWGIIIALCVYLVLYALLGRIWLAGIVGNIAFFIFSLISYFTLLFRGLPLIPSDIFSAGTAMNVLGNYELKMSDQIFLILAIFIFTMILSLIARVKIERRSVRQSLLLRVSAIAPAVFVD